MEIKCHTLRWVKSNCILKNEGTSCALYEYPKSPFSVLWYGRMTDQLCGNTFTVIETDDKYYKVKESTFYVPRWLVVSKSKKADFTVDKIIREMRGWVDSRSGVFVVPIAEIRRVLSKQLGENK